MMIAARCKKQHGSNFTRLFFRTNRKHLISLNQLENVALNPADNLVATRKGNHEVEFSRRRSN